MLVSYLQNSELGVTKDTYFEMCEMMGTEPIESEIPVEIDDFPPDMLQAFTVYRMLNDVWDGMSGTYMGKMFVGIKDVLEVAQVSAEDHSFIILLCKLIDEVRQQEINKKKESPRS